MRRIDYWIIGSNHRRAGATREVIAVAGDPARRATVPFSRRSGAVWLSDEQLDGLVAIGFRFYLAEPTYGGYARGAPVASSRQIPAEPLRLMA